MRARRLYDDSPYAGGRKKPMRTLYRFAHTFFSFMSSVIRRRYYHSVSNALGLICYWPIGHYQLACSVSIVWRLCVYRSCTMCTKKHAFFPIGKIDGGLGERGRKGGRANITQLIYYFVLGNRAFFARKSTSASPHSTHARGIEPYTRFRMGSVHIHKMNYS